MKYHVHALLVLYLAVFLLSLNGLFAKLIPLDAVSMTQIRSVIAILGFLVFGLLGQRRLKAGCLTQQLGVMALGVLLGIHWVTFFHSMQVSTVAIGMLSLFSFPIMTILLEPFFIKDRLQLRDVVAGLIVFSGIMVMVSQDLSDLGSSVVQGVFWGAVSALLFSLRNLIQKYYFSNVPSDSLMFHQVVAVAIMLVPFADVSAIKTLTPMSWGALLVLGVFSTATAHTLLSYSLKHLAAKSVALISSSQPLIATILAWLVLLEVPQVSVAVGGLLILAVAMYESLNN